MSNLMQQLPKRWKTIPENQLSFLNHLIGSSEWADLQQKYDICQLQDCMDWVWNQPNMTTPKATEMLLGLDEEAIKRIGKSISKRIDDGSDSFQLSVGDSCFYTSNNESKSVVIKDIKVDFSCAYGGLYPINISFEDGEQQEQDDWFDCFGTGVNGNTLTKTDRTVKKFTDAELEIAKQCFIENLYASFRWAVLAERMIDSHMRFNFMNELWVKFQSMDGFTSIPLDHYGYHNVMMEFLAVEMAEYE